MARKNNEEQVEVKCSIANTGNWNRKGGKKLPGKSLAIVTIGEDNFVLTHDEILDIIGHHVEADERNILFIDNPSIDTGNCTKSEISFKEKILNALN